MLRFFPIFSIGIKETGDLLFPNKLDYKLNRNLFYKIDEKDKRTYKELLESELIFVKTILGDWFKC